MLLQLPVTLEKSQSRRNRAWRLTFDSQENVPGEIIAAFNDNLDKFGWLAFLVGERQIEPEDVKDLPELPKTDDDKTPSQRLRDRMFVYFRDRKIVGDFNSWYAKQLDIIGQQYLDKLT